MLPPSSKINGATSNIYSRASSGEVIPVQYGTGTSTKSEIYGIPTLSGNNWRSQPTNLKTIRSPSLYDP